MPCASYRVPLPTFAMRRLLAAACYATTLVPSFPAVNTTYPVDDLQLVGIDYSSYSRALPCVHTEPDFTRGRRLLAHGHK